MTRRYRSFEIQGVPHHLDEAPDVRARDLDRGEATVVREDTGETYALRAADLNIALPASVPPIEPERRVDLRCVMERGIELDYADIDIVELIEIARRHALLREARA